MKQRWIMSAAAAMALSFAVAPTQAALKITEAMSSSGTGGTNDWFELYNNGSSAVPVSGYRMDDNSNSFALSVPMTGITSIAPGEYVVFVESTTADPATEVANFKTFWGGLSSVQVGTYTGSGVSLGSTTDDVHVFDSAGNAIDGVTFGAATTGDSFDFTGGSTPVVSTFRPSASSAPQNLGTPGAVPEPASMGLLAVAAAGMLFRRR